MKFFFDNCFSKQLAEAINILDREDEAIHLSDRFPPDTKDELWLKYIGRNNIFLITRDTRIRRHAAEKEAFKKHSVGAFILIGKTLDKWQIIRSIINNWEKIKKTAKNTRRPFAFKIKRNGIEPLSL